jgi:hypothetical protein
VLAVTAQLVTKSVAATPRIARETLGPIDDLLGFGSVRKAPGIIVYFIRLRARANRLLSRACFG